MGFALSSFSVQPTSIGRGGQTGDIVSMATTTLCKHLALSQSISFRKRRPIHSFAPAANAANRDCAAVTPFSRHFPARFAILERCGISLDNYSIRLASRMPRIPAETTTANTKAFVFISNASFFSDACLAH